MVRSLRHLMAGSLVLTAAAVSVAAWVGFALAMTPTPVAAVTLSRAIVTTEQPLALSDGSTLLTNPDAAARAVEQSPALAATADVDAVPQRRAGSSAVSVVSDEAVARDGSASATSTPPQGQPPASVALADTLHNSPLFEEPVQGLTPPPTRVEERSALVARAAARDDEPLVVEASYPIDASVLQTPMLQPGDVVEATISFYYCAQGEAPEGGDGGEFCGVMRDGTVVYDGAAACAWAYLGQRFIIVGDPLERVYTCADTGSAVHGLHRDIWFYSAQEGWIWQLSIGTTGLLVIVD